LGGVLLLVVPLSVGVWMKKSRAKAAKESESAYVGGGWGMNIQGDPEALELAKLREMEEAAKVVPVTSTLKGTPAIAVVAPTAALTAMGTTSTVSGKNKDGAGESAGEGTGAGKQPTLDPIAEE
jgi:hypothetical protein